MRNTKIEFFENRWLTGAITVFSFALALSIWATSNVSTYPYLAIIMFLVFSLLVGWRTIYPKKFIVIEDGKLHINDFRMQKHVIELDAVKDVQILSVATHGKGWLRGRGIGIGKEIIFVTNQGRIVCSAPFTDKPLAEIVDAIRAERSKQAE